MYEIMNPQNSGRVIALWSPVSRQGAVSTTAAMLASYMGKKVDDGKILVLSTDASGGPTSGYYMTTERLNNGLAEVIELSISDNLKSAEDIANNTYSVTPNIDILPCSKMASNVTDFLNREIVNILNVARQGYKYIVVDTIYGKFDMATSAVLKNCDALVVCMPQDKYIFESWVRKMDTIYLDLVERKPTVVVSALHFEYSDMKYSDMNRELKGRELFYISLNDVVHKAVSERDIPGMIASNMGGKRPDDAVEEIGAIYDQLVRYIDKLIDKEMENERELAEKSKKETQEYLASNEELFQDMGYGEEYAVEAADNSYGQSDMDDLYENSGSES